MQRAPDLQVSKLQIKSIQNTEVAKDTVGRINVARSYGALQGAVSRFSVQNYDSYG